ncbi:ABC transporter substrate-binding protein [Nonomuraea sp. H19]|uniref:ABC transporter substrate-binding protein n=1 Tax=Nonomuraea sp. H19 TaxID=3452206 RepID=UPI003F8A4CD3
MGTGWRGVQVADLRSVIEVLIRRPAFWRADPPLPTVLVTGPQALAAVEMLAEPFHDCVPYAYVKDGEHESVVELVKSLAGEQGQLGKPVGGSLLPPPRFPLAQFVLWAREQRGLPPQGAASWPPEPHSHTGYQEFKKRLKEWRRRASSDDRGVRTRADFLTRAATTWVPVGTLAVWWAGGAADLVGVIPWLLGLVVALAGTAAQGVLSIRGSLFTRWFSGAPALKRKRFERLPQYALRLANAPAPEIEELLVHALMQDLHEAYKKWIIPWPSWGRGLHSLLVLQITDPDGINARFLWLTEEITKKSGLLAPMVVLAAVPEVTSRPQDRPEDLGNLEDAVRRWRETARLGVPDLRLTIEATALPPSPPPYQPPPRRARAMGYWAAMALLLVVPLASVYWIQRDRAEHCGGLPWVERIEDECVGIVNATRATPGDLFDGEVERLIKKIDANNVYATDSGRYVSMVLFGEFSIKKTAEDDTRLAAAVSELAAVEEYQRTVSSTPRLRVLIANAGDNFDHGRRTAQLITEMAEQNPHVMGVVGLPRSVRGISEAIQELHLAKIPMVSSTATADGLGYIKNTARPDDPGDPSPYFFHVGPTNFRQATLGARFARRTLLPAVDEPSAVIVEDRSTGDEYTYNLADDFEKALTAEEVKVAGRIPYTVEQGGISSAAEKACKLQPDVLIYAGRASEFRAFLTAIEGQACGQVKVIAGDDVIKVVTDHGEAIANMKQVEVYYMALASRALWRPDLATAFVSKLLKGAHAKASDDNLILTYDAADVVYRAAEAAYRAASAAGGEEDERLPSQGDILYRLARTSGEHAWAGSSGVMDFNATERHTPTDKAIAIMKVERSQWGYAQPKVRCGRLDTNEPPSKEALCVGLPNT